MNIMKIFIHHAVVDYDISGLRQKKIAGLTVIQYEEKKYFQSELY